MTEDRLTTVAFTGHRTYGGQAAAALRATVGELYARGFRTFLCGMAMGFDLAAAEAVLACRDSQTASVFSPAAASAAAFPSVAAFSAVPPPPGRTRVRRHQLGEAVAKGADLAIITTDDPDRDDPAEVIADIATCFGPGSCPHVGIVDRREAVRYALEQLCPGDMLLLCGKGREGYQLVQGKKIPYDEEETVRSCARELLESRPQAL